MARSGSSDLRATNEAHNETKEVINNYLFRYGHEIVENTQCANIFMYNYTLVVPIG